MTLHLGDMLFFTGGRPDHVYQQLEESAPEAARSAVDELRRATARMVASRGGGPELDVADATRLATVRAGRRLAEVAKDECGLQVKAPGEDEDD